MAKPIIRRIGVIDATQENTVQIVWSGTRSYGIRAIIKESDTNETIWDNTETTYFLSVTIPAGVLTNGNSYTIQVRTLSADGGTLGTSDSLNFSTLSTPTFAFSNVPSPITNASYSASVTYSSPELEELSSYTFYLYDTTRKQLLKSSTLYGSNPTYTYKGLVSDTDYYIRCTGVTARGLAVDTGYKRVSVNISDPPEYSLLYVDNLPDRGGVQLNTNLVVIEADSKGNYEFEDGRILLQNKDLVYNKGFNVPDDFTVILKGMELWKDDTLLYLKHQGKNPQIILSSHIYGDNTLRFKLSVSNGLSTYIIYSDPMKFKDEDEVVIGIRRINNVYSLTAFIDVDAATDGDYWYGNAVPANAEDLDQWYNTDGDTEHYAKDDVTVYLGGNEPASAIVGDLWFSDSDYSSAVTEEDVKTADDLDAYIAEHGLDATSIAALTLEQMTLYLQWFNSLIVIVKKRFEAELLTEFRTWAEEQAALINNWYTTNGSPSSLTSQINEMVSNVNSI